MGGMHAQIYQQLPNAQLVAVADAAPERARENLATLGIEIPVYDSLEKMLEKEALDLVDICLPTDLHLDACMQAIEAGKALFCEKPLALNGEDADRIVAAAEARNTPFQVGHAIRFWPEYQALENFTREQKAGKLLSLTMQRRAGRPAYTEGNWILDGKRSMGAILDLHIHDTDFVHHLLGKPTAVTSRGTYEETGGWTHVFTDYHFDDVVVQAEGGWNYPTKWGFQMAFQAIYENGTVEYDSNASPTLRHTIGNSEPAPLEFSNPETGDSRSGTGNVSSLGGYFNELQYFINCLNQGKAPDIATGRQSAQSVRTVMAEIESARTGRTVKL